MFMAVYSALFYAFFLGYAALCFCVAVVIKLVTWPFDRNGLVLHLFSCFWAQTYFQMHPFWRMQVRGREKLPWKGGAVYACNHQSLGDVLVFFGLYRPFKWVSKKAVFSLPFLGWNMRMNGYVPITRGDKDSVVRMFEHCKYWLRRGVPVLMFPEGTRSPDESVQKFKDGAFQLALDEKVPVYPMVVCGSGATLPKHGWKVQLRSRCVVQILDPVSPEGHTVESLRDHVRDLIVTEKARIDAELAAAA